MYGHHQHRQLRRQRLFRPWREFSCLYPTNLLCMQWRRRPDPIIGACATMTQNLFDRIQRSVQHRDLYERQT